jgi:chemotaxis protein CheC
MFNLSELENDALIEIFNIGVGQAAASMSAIVNEAVRMSVPSISFIPRAEAARLLGKKDGVRSASAASASISRAPSRPKPS